MPRSVNEAATALENRLGYVYRDSALFRQALTHRSFGTPNYERLEFLGDALLNAIIAKSLFDRHPQLPEGELSRLRANMVNQSALAAIAAELGLGESLLFGDGELRSGGKNRPSILADALESLIGAAYLDSGFAATEALVTHLFAPLLNGPLETTATKDAKTALQEWLQAKHHALPIYTVVNIDGAAHQQTFHVNCLLQMPAVSASGSGASRRVAEQDAAARVLARLMPTPHDVV